MDFGRRPAALGSEEHRVVAEPAVAAPRVQDVAVPAAFGDKRLRVFGVAQQHDCGVEVSAAALVGNLAQRVEQLVEVRLRSDENTYEFQSLMRNSYADFCLTKKKKHNNKKLEHRN